MYISLGIWGYLSPCPMINPNSCYESTQWWWFSQLHWCNSEIIPADGLCPGRGSVFVTCCCHRICPLLGLICSSCPISSPVCSPCPIQPLLALPLLHFIPDLPALLSFQCFTSMSGNPMAFLVAHWLPYPMETSKCPFIIPRRPQVAKNPSQDVAKAILVSLHHRSGF